MIGRSNTGGGGGMPTNAAVIHVVAPIGSSVSFSKGGVTVKVLDASKGHANVGGLTADYYYSVSASNYGTWTVAATKDGATSTKTVTVDSAKQYDVSVYSLYLYKDGVYTQEYSHEQIKNATVTDQTTYIQTSTTANKASYCYVRWASVDLTPVSTITYVGQGYTPNHSSDGAVCPVFITLNQSVTWCQDSVAWTAADVKGSSYANFEINLDVTHYIGNWYIACGQETYKAAWGAQRLCRITSLLLH